MGPDSGLVMRWMPLCLCLSGAAFYAANTATLLRDERHLPKHGVAAIEPDEPDRGSTTTGPKGTTQESASKVLPNENLQAQTTRQTSETDAPEPRSNSLATNTLPSVDTEQLHHPRGKLLRGASVHSAPSISSAILGYGAAGTPMRLVKRELGWVRVRDPATSREGWIHEEHIAVESPKATGGELAPGDALASADDEVSEQPARSFKSKKPRKAYKAKKSRKTYASKQVTPTRFGRRGYRRCAAWSDGFCVQNY